MEASVLMVWIGSDVNVHLGLLVLTAELVSTCMGKDLKDCTILTHKLERTPCYPFFIRLAEFQIMKQKPHVSQPGTDSL